MMFQKNIWVVLIFLILSCSGKKEKKTIIDKPEIPTDQMADSSKIDLTEKSKASSFDEIFNAVEFKKLIIIDTTNFDNFHKTIFFNEQEVGSLQLQNIYPNFYKEGYNYKATPSYKIEMSENFQSIVLTVLKGEHEMESLLVNYDLAGEMVDYKIISYDEIAEGWSRIESKIEKNKVTVTTIHWIDEREEEAEVFEIDVNGKMKPTSKD